MNATLTLIVVGVALAITLFFRWRYQTILACVYDSDGKCRECKHPKHLDGLTHHPNCPVGRLGL